ncbi:peptidyl-prolyl cis-trans isomerase, putative [Plasmodium knowlesi strain H]|uniref:Peptidyl-prolyl cis-trans isomerase, putative n=3 Tax=Plasmodium knowlesi TaxID=5850 RepID=A0A1A7VCB7_PLAKH|nr:peptidyl-prolyl cis-trans isomerase, putative [Plasmodium knowlesi strain H]OTN67600.1 putative Peptidyl-prolyl cis-trans isomerase [Plasmodium knowlesi]CAA9990379.1 peptidyl-prolyl cis-trans isomerase, putative [Plasmodium knowlesi strain H]SBO19585.1 peptidyl-prolyl cis-trans isomerase, putative [Plasmodium knowlesi strain H]SBO22657.1 peptidyl-prolyl cis-trans isomerase, putative [Plasmodium knowlesi strain H]VVS79853.1 peptidyl-prolyl cis-trans isomerase, putative [Plasmodium knowlesi s
MSEVYSIEPKTSGKLTIYTSLGELEVHLFSNECPVACQNFIQLCLNNYYNGNKFFRIIPKFLIQTGDHTNTGLHNEYAFKEPFQNECNRRLKFLYAGCISFANLNIEKPSNGSQFFITLDKAEYLNNKSTLFGKVAKHSIYNLLKFNNIKTNKNDEPIEDAPYIQYIKIEENPFHHLVPYANYEREVKEKCHEDGRRELHRESKRLKGNLLSFGFDAEDTDKEEEMADKGEDENDGENDDEEGAVDGGKEQEERESQSGDTPHDRSTAEDITNRNPPEEELQRGTSLGRNKRDNKIVEEKIDRLKKKTNDIEMDKAKRKERDSAVRDLGSLDEAYLRKIRKYNKMSKREREKQSLQKLEEFDNRLKGLFSRDGETNKALKHDWLNTQGLKFRIDSANAYEHEDIKKKVVNPMDSENKRPYDSKFSMEKYIKEKRSKEDPAK